MFLTYRGTAWVRMGKDSRTDYVSTNFNRLVKRLGLARPGRAFYTLRHVFRTVADARASQKFNHLRGLVVSEGQAGAFQSPGVPEPEYFQRLDQRVQEIWAVLRHKPTLRIL